MRSVVALRTRGARELDVLVLVGRVGDSGGEGLRHHGASDHISRLRTTYDIDGSICIAFGVRKRGRTKEDYDGKHKVGAFR